MDSKRVTLNPDTINTLVAEAFPGSRVRCATIGADFATATLATDDIDVRPGGYISGPTQFAVVDAALWYLVFAVLGRFEPMAVTAELSIRYVRPAIGARLHARAELDSITRRRLVGTVRVWVDDDADRPSAIAQGTYALPDGT